MDAHITSEELAQLRSGKLSPSDALRVLRHRDACPQCRGVRGNTADLRLLRGLVDFDRCPGQDPDGEQLLVEFFLGQLPAEKSEFLAAHTSGCAQCQGILNELRDEQAELTSSRREVAVMPKRRPPALRLAAAAAVIAAIGGAVWLAAHRQGPLEASDRIRDGGSVLERRGSGEWAGLALSDPSDREVVASVLRSGHLPTPLTAIETPPPAVLRGAAGSAPFSLTSPAYARVESESPEFSWTAWSEAARYQVAVYTMDSRVLEISPELPGSTTSWVPARPLPRGLRLAWQVTATPRRGEPVLVPAPPAPPVFFEVIDGQAAERIAKAKAAPAPSHLLLAALYAEQGLTRQAQDEIRSLSRENPDSQLVRGLVQPR